jgi:lysophospholipase L1-like esterase
VVRLGFPGSRRACLAAMVGIATLAVVGASAGTATATVGAHSALPHQQAPVTAGADYLALGDSVAFGYRESTNLPTPNYADAASFVGYPEDIGAALGLKVANASCPGETSASLVAKGALSNGCENRPGSSVGYRTAFPLHVRYQGTQLAYAVHYLRNHRNTELVTLMIGANDAFICESLTSDDCASEIGAVAAKISANVRTILTAVRDKAGYDGQIVIVNYYSLDYRSATANAGSQVLNAAQDSAAQPFDVSIADGYGIFQQAAAQAGGDSCAAGLLTTLTTGGCGVHPSVAGQAVLALAVEKAIKR